jgi:hypothetical protein
MTSKTTPPVGEIERAMRTAAHVISKLGPDLGLAELTARVLERHPALTERAITTTLIEVHRPRSTAERRARQVYEAAIARAKAGA